MKLVLIMLTFFLHISLYAYDEETEVHVILESGPKTLKCLAKTLAHKEQHIFCQEGEDMLMITQHQQQMSAIYQNKDGFKKAQILRIDNKVTAYQSVEDKNFSYHQDDQKAFNELNTLEAELGNHKNYPFNEEESEVLKLKKEFHKRLSSFKSQIKNTFDTHRDLELEISSGQKIQCYRGAPESCLLYHCDPVTIEGKTYQVQFNNTTLETSLKSPTLLLANQEELGPSLEVKQVKINDRSFFSSETPRPSPFAELGKSSFFNGSNFKSYTERLPKPFSGEIPELKGKEQSYALLDDSYSKRMREFDLKECNDEKIKNLESLIQDQYLKLQEQITQKKLIELVRFADGKIQRELILESDIKPNMCHIGGDVWAQDKGSEKTLKESLKGNISKTKKIPFEELEKIFEFAKNQKDIPWAHYQDGCFARAHTLSEKLSQEMGLETEKIWAFGHLSPEIDPEIVWSYHVATRVDVERNGKVEPYVLDPSVSDKPLKENEWLEKINPKKLHTTKTSWPAPTETGLVKQIAVSYSPWEVYFYKEDELNHDKKKENSKRAQQENERYQKALDAK